MIGKTEKDLLLRIKSALLKLLELFARPVVVVLVIMLVVVLFMIKSCIPNKTLIIFHGPYFVYTPISLLAQIQKEYNKKYSIMSYLVGTDSIIKVEMCTSSNLSYAEGWWQCIERTDENNLKNLVLFTNSYFWLTLNEGKLTDSCWQRSPSGDWYQFAVIGYKKAQKPYYTSRFIWHKKLRFPDLNCVPDSFSFLLNCMDESGSTHVVPELYLLENCGKDYPSVAWDTRQNIVKECVSKRQMIGVISNSEYSEQLDNAMKDSLCIKDIMVNIPHDPVVMVKRKIKTSLGKDSFLIKCKMDSAQLANNEIDKSGWKNFLRRKDLIITEKDSDCYKRTVWLQHMLRYYVSMGVVRPVLDSMSQEETNRYRIVLQNGDWLGINKLEDTDSVVVFKTIYGNLEDHYYTFDSIRTLAKKNIGEKEIGCRTIPVDSAKYLMGLMKRCKLLNNSRYDNH